MKIAMHFQYITKQISTVHSECWCSAMYNYDGHNKIRRLDVQEY